MKLTKSATIPVLPISLAFLMSATAAQAITILASADSSGRSTSSTAISSSNNGNLGVGPVADGDFFRSYLTFDLTNESMAAGSTTISFSAISNENNTSSLAQVFTLFSLPADWNGAAQPGPTGTPLATVNFTPTTGSDSQALSFSSAALTTAFNAALGSSLYVGIMSDAEGDDVRSFKWLASSEDGALAPMLTYTAVPEPTTSTLMALMAFAGLTKRNRRF